MNQTDLERLIDMLRTRTWNRLDMMDNRQINAMADSIEEMLPDPVTFSEEEINEDEDEDEETEDEE